MPLAPVGSSWLVGFTAPTSAHSTAPAHDPLPRGSGSGNPAPARRPLGLSCTASIASRLDSPSANLRACRTVRTHAELLVCSTAPLLLFSRPAL
ncbi:hypothetical protein EKO04_011165 [Ascochyta lentis]|uniref:Uncharacterized protein n=1 Tax=Ascochyta lentis TaxID=205686 RepID=A0A8H7IUT9_9PLEO|nr:hypothetical protein EKO04_011165 [Ascochyta lentis]